MFSRARLVLTFWYAISMLLISTMFSFGLYRLLVREIEQYEIRVRQRIERRLFEGRAYSLFVDPNDIIMVDPEALNDVRKRVLINLGIINLGIFGTSWVIGFLLSGRTLQPIQEMTDKQRRFISDASHELKTPLTSLKTAFEVFLRQKHKTLPEAEEIIAESIAEVDTLHELSTSLLTLSTYESNTSVRNYGVVVLRDIFDSVAKRIEPIAQKKQVTVHIQTDTSLTLVSDLHGIEQVCMILVDNAVKYSKVGGTVTLSGSKKGRYCTVTCKDTGIGIPKSDLEKVFDRFYRVDDARSSDVAGHGLGLAIAKQIVTDLGGTIVVQSKQGEGSLFTLSIPLKTNRKN